MEMTGEYRIPAGRRQVWEALNDPEVLKASIPGCESLTKVSDDEMTARVVSKIGPVKATFNGKVRLSDINPPESYTISGEGQGGVAGFARGGADVRLVEDGPATVLTYRARAQVGGKLAQLGARLIDSTAKMMADQFFSRFSEIVSAQAAAAAEPVAAAPLPSVEAPPRPAAAATPPATAPETARPSAAPRATEAPARPAGGLPAWIWIVVAVAIVVAIVYWMR